MNDTTLTATIWLHLLAEGGRWTTSEIRKLVGTDYHLANTRLFQMAQRGMVVSYDGTERSNSRVYGVNVNCRVPQGVTLAQITAALEGQ